ncbi:copper resistance CopC family protein [Micromonospora sp. CPCC 205556]|uniref:copper resistance CopC family protein n=1 Tax=Micromonospora sp. CPCC 205556 TaxID=3122398 RepID=UPI002FEE8526
MALGVSLLPATPAFAHNSLTGSNPADGARVAAAPARIELRFLAKPDPGTTKITLVGPDNVPAAGGAPSFTGSRVSVPFRPGKAGLYIVGYQVASSDGHPVRGEVRFTLTTGTPAESASAAAPGPSATAGAPAESASPGAPGPSASATAKAPSASVATAATSAVPASDVRQAGDGGRAWPWVLGAVLAAAALAAALLLRRRRPAGG